jgi:hypothetical protein
VRILERCEDLGEGYVVAVSGPHVAALEFLVMRCHARIVEALSQDPGPELQTILVVFARVEKNEARVLE